MGSHYEALRGAHRGGTSMQHGGAINECVGGKCGPGDSDVGLGGLGEGKTPPTHQMTSSTPKTMPETGDGYAAGACPRPGGL